MGQDLTAAKRPFWGCVKKSSGSLCDWVWLSVDEGSQNKDKKMRTHKNPLLLSHWTHLSSATYQHTNHTSHHNIIVSSTHRAAASRGHRAPWAPLCFWLQRHLTPNRSSTRSTQINLYDVFVAWTISKHQPSRNSKLYPGFILAKKFPTEIIIAIIL